MSLVYWLSKFSHEAMLIELFLIGCVSLSYFGYLLVQKRRYGVNKKQIPDHIVRAFLIELLSYSEGFKNQLFGESLQATPGAGLTQAATAAPAAGDSADSAALKTALAAAVTKQSELQKLIDALTKDKSALEAKVAAGAGKAAPAASGADPKALADAMDKIAKLESKLAEYEVIEDDLANLKKYQQENKQLKAQLEGKGGAAPIAAAPEPVAAAPAPEPAAAPEAAAPEPAAAAAAEPTPVAAAEESAATDSAAANFDRLVDKVEESLATPAGASAVDPAAAAQAQTAPPVVEEAAAPPPPEPAAAAAPAPAPAAAPKEAPRDKSDADLLNEFERMLSS